MSVSNFFTQLASRINTNVGIKVVTISANRIANRARQNAPTSKIAKAIHVGSAQVEADRVSIQIKINTDEETGAPEAFAYEYGSGEHATRGEPGTYVIEPKNADLLAFFWDKTPRGTGEKFVGIADDGRKLFRYVDHPGVAARPYMKPAVDDEASSIIGRILNTVAEELENLTVELTR